MGHIVRQEEIDRAKELRRSGYTYHLVGKIMGIPRSTAWNRVNREYEQVWDGVLPEFDLTETDYAYIAGLMDGEGSLGVYMGGRKSFFPRVRLSNTDELLLKYIEEKLPVGICARDQHGLGDKRIYLYDVSAYVNQYALLKRIYKYLVIKKVICMKVLKFLEERLGVNKYGLARMDESTDGVLE